MEKTLTCWTLSPGTIACRRQIFGIANALNLTIQDQAVRRKKPWSFLPAHITFGTSKQITPPWPDVILSSGNCSIPYALAARKANKNTKLIHIQKPSISSDHFDLVITPAHDHAKGNNIIETFGATHDITHETLDAARSDFSPRFKPYKAPFLSIFIGGSHKKYDFTASCAAQIATTLLNIAKEYPGTLLITGSRRTGTDNMAYFEKRFRDQGNIYLYNNIGKNPYLGMLALADTIMVTDDSISMISEAAVTGKPIYIFKLPGQKQRPKISQFIDDAVKRNHVRYYKNSLAPFDAEKLNEVARITPQLKSFLSL